MSLERMIHLGSLIEVDQTEVMNWLPQIVKRYKVPMETHGITWVSCDLWDAANTFSTSMRSCAKFNAKRNGAPSFEIYHIYLNLEGCTESINLL